MFPQTFCRSRALSKNLLFTVKIRKNVKKKIPPSKIKNKILRVLILDTKNILKVITINKNTKSETIMDIMSKNKIRHIPIVENKLLIGIVSIGDVVKRLLEKFNLNVEDIGLWELNEAFASQSIACIKDLGMETKKINIDGGAIALGHPLGATGARITGKAAELLQREGGKYALSTQCIGLGMGIATIIESV